MRMSMLWATALGVSAGLAMPALALSPGEAEAVVEIVERLAEETGEGMVVDAAGIFFDYDSLGASLIPEAGFDRQSWVTAYEAVASGYMATLSEDEFNGVFEEPLAMLEKSALPEDQKQMFWEHVESLIADAKQTRLAGMAYVDVVRPLEDRLYPLFFGE